MKGRARAYGIRTRSCRYFVLFFFLPVIFSGCGGTLKSEGSVALFDNTGNSLPFTGATATLFPLNADLVIPGQSPKGIGAGVVAADGSTVTVSARASAIRNARLYAVEFRCPAAVSGDDCKAESPLHVVLNGAQIRAGRWQATVLTEAVFRNATYAVATQHTAAQVWQVLDNASAALMTATTQNDAATYADVLAWNPGDLAAVRRPGQLADFTSTLIAGNNPNAVQLQAQILTDILMATLALEGSVHDVAVMNDRAYLVHSAYDRPVIFSAIDVSDPSRPVLTATLDGLGIRTLQVAGNYVYAVDAGYSTSNSSALHIFDLAYPDQPEYLTRFTIAGRPTDIAIAGNTAFVAQVPMRTDDPGFAGVQVVDISTPEMPVLIGSLPIESGLNHLAVSGNRVLGAGQNGLYVIDVSNPAEPSLLQAQPGNLTQDIIIADQYAYLLVNSTLRIIDIDNPSLPVVGSLPDVEGSHLNKVGTILYAGRDIIDVSAPFAPQRIGRLPMNINPMLVLPDGLAYVAGHSSLHIYDTRVAHQPPMLEGQTPVTVAETIIGLPDNTVATNGFAFAPHDTGTMIFDLSDPLAPQHIATTWDDYLSDLTLDPPYAYAGKRGIGSWYIFDISNPSAIEEWLPQVGSVDSGKEDSIVQMTIALAGHYAFASFLGYIPDPDSDTGAEIPGGGLFVIDIQTPSAPHVAALYTTTPSAETVTIVGQYAYLMLSDGTLEIVDISNALSPVRVNSLSLSGQVFSLTTSGDQLYAPAGNLGLHVISIANPASPVLIGAARTTGFAGGVFLHDEYLYASTGYGFEILRKIPSTSAAP